MSIVVLASCTLDVNLYVDRLPERQGDSFVRHKEIKTGGCAYHVARSISDCTLCFPLGTGLYSDLVQKDLFNADFDLYLPRTEEESGVCYCLIEPDGERTFLGNHGAEYHYRKEWLEDLDEFDWAYVSGIDMEEKGNTCILDFIKERNMKFLFAPGPRLREMGDLLDTILSMKPVLHMNTKEVKDWTGKEKEEGMKELFAITGMPVIVTDSSNGAYCFDGQMHFVPTTPIKVKNATGAGDTHAGMCLKGLDLGWSIDKMLEEANKKAGEKMLENNK